MAFRKVSKQDVQNAYAMAEKAKENAQYSAQRAKQLKDGADKMNYEYKRQQATRRQSTRPQNNSGKQIRSNYNGGKKN